MPDSPAVHRDVPMDRDVPSIVRPSNPLENPENKEIIFRYLDFKNHVTKTMNSQPLAFPSHNTIFSALLDTFMSGIPLTLLIVKYNLFSEEDEFTFKIFQT